MSKKNFENLLIEANKKYNKKTDILISIIIITVVIINYLSIITVESSLSSMQVFDSETYKQVASALLVVLVVVVSISGVSIRSIFLAHIYRQKKIIALLRLLGFTKKQIKKILWKEIFSIYLFSFLIGISVALIFNFIIPVNRNIWMIVSSIIFTVFFTYLMIRFSLSFPLKEALSVEPLEAMRDAEETNKNKKSFKKIVYPKNLAMRFFLNNKKRTLWILTSLILTTTIMFVVLTVINSFNPERLASRSYLYNSNVIIEINPDVDEYGNHSYENVMKKSPLNKDLEERIKNVPNTLLFRSKLINLSLDDSSEDTLTIQNIINEDTVNRKAVDSLKKFTNDENLIPVIINKGAYWYMNGSRKYKTGDIIEAKLKNGESVKNIKLIVADFIDKKDDLVIYYTEDKFIEKLSDENCDFIWYIKSKDINKIKDIINTVNKSDILKVSFLTNEIQSYKVMFQNIMIIIFAFGSLLCFFAFINLFDLLISNFFARKQSYEILRIIGTSKKELMKIINIENCIYFANMIFFSIIISVPLGYFACLKISSYFHVNYVLYKFPFIFLFLYLLVVLFFYCLLLSVQKKFLDRKK